MQEQEQSGRKDEWREWRPPFAPFVVGRYQRRSFDHEVGMPNPQKVTMECTSCAVTWQTMCATGNVRSHIAKFARLHLHRDVLDPATDPSLKAIRAQILKKRAGGSSGKG